MKTINIKSNTSVWRKCTNRHPTTGGRDWGWIEGSGAGGFAEITWSDDSGSDLKGAEAAMLVSQHNQWLEDSRPVELKLIDARNRADAARLIVADRAKSLSEAQAALDKETDEITRLCSP